MQTSLTPLTATLWLQGLLSVAFSGAVNLNVRYHANLYDRAVNLLLQHWHRRFENIPETLEPKEQEVLAAMASQDHEVSVDDLRKGLSLLALESYEDAIVFRRSSVIGCLDQVFDGLLAPGSGAAFLQLRRNILMATSRWGKQIYPPDFSYEQSAKQEYRRDGLSLVESRINIHKIFVLLPVLKQPNCPNVMSIFLALIRAIA